MTVQIPIQCLSIRDQVDNLNAQLDSLQEELQSASPVDKPRLIKQIVAKENAISTAEDDLNSCIIANPPAQDPPKATIPTTILNTDTTLQKVVKVIPWNLLQKKMDLFFNQRTAPPIFKIRFHHHDSVDNDPPASDVTIFMVEAEVENGQVVTDYQQVSYFDLDKLDDDYYFDDINSSSITVALEPTSPTPLTIKVAFETGGPTEAPTTTHLLPDLDMLEFYITLKLSFDAIRVPAGPPPQCLDLKNNLDNLNGQLDSLQEQLNTAAPQNKPAIIKQITAKQTEIANAEDQLKACFITYGGPDPFAFGRLDFLSWIDKIAGLRDDDFENALTQYVVAHIVSPNKTDVGGTFQKKIRHKIYDKLSDSTMRIKFNNEISRWILGGTGNYDVLTVTNDGVNITINYMVPANKLDPFPEAKIRPDGWPYLNNPNPSEAFNFTVPSNLSNIKHIVVLTMENRSFDHMLGYLRLPVTAGGMGREEVDGLKGNESNTFNGVTTASFAFAAGDTAFAPDPGHSYEPVFTQINDDLNNPGNGKMDGFVKAYANEHGLGAGPRIMGYHLPVNVPVYDALTRDFAISHRWFASHPGPTFCNRFYELTGRLNLASGLNDQIPENTWEFSNSSPLTPVFNKTIFDFLNDYQQQIEKAVTWKYYEDHYCFLRFFSKHTFNNTNVVSMDDPANGFFADCQKGTLPSVAYIDPHFIELPPDANCDGPVADIKAGQELVRKVVEAVVTSPVFANTLLIITYDEHGGFFDHVKPPVAQKFSHESPINTYGVRVPAFFISPWVTGGKVFGHDKDANQDALLFDHTSILKTIAKRFMSKNPPYMGKRYEKATDLVPILENTWRRFTFLPFIRYNFMFNASQKLLDVSWGNLNPGNKIWIWNKNGSQAQDFSIEEKHDFVYIRTHTGNLYVTVHVPGSPTAPPPEGFGIKQDLKYEGALATSDPKKYEPKYQLWKLTPTGTTDADKNMYIISNAAFPNKILQPVDLITQGASVVLIDKPATISIANAWKITSPAIK